MTPSLLPRKLFRLQIVPRHDVGGKVEAASNVIVHPLALSYFDQPAAEFQAVQLRSREGLTKNERLWGLALGDIGSRADRWFEDEVLQGLKRIREEARAAGYRLIITTSRRTSPEVARLLTEEIFAGEDRHMLAHLLDASVSHENPLPAMYELCEAMLVTGDSYSMVCEALQAGHKPVVLSLGRSGSKKVERAIELLHVKGLTTRFTDTAEWVERNCRIFAPNQYYDELRAEVRSRLELD